MPTGKMPKIVIYDLLRADPVQDFALFERIYEKNVKVSSTISKVEHIAVMRRVSLFGSKISPTFIVMT